MDKFPEAFERFEEDVDIEEIEGFNELRMEFIHWLGQGWKNSVRQNAALNHEVAVTLQHKQEIQRKQRIRPRRRFETLRRIPRNIARREAYAPGASEYYVLPYGPIQAQVKSKIERGYSANQIQKQLQNQGIGVRRQVLLQQIREQRHQPPREHREKYTPKKYRKRPQT